MLATVRLPIFLLRSDQRTGKQASFLVIAGEVARKLRRRAIVVLYQAGYALFDVLYISNVFLSANLQKEMKSLALAARHISLWQAGYSLFEFLKVVCIPISEVTRTLRVLAIRALYLTLGQAG